MKILVSPDKFKGSLTAWEAAGTLAQALGSCIPGAKVLVCPVADGGDGTLDVLADPLKFSRVTVPVHDPLGRTIESSFGLTSTSQGRLALVEMARASGLSLLKSGERDPLRTSTLGTGELVLAAVESGAREVLVALGGSATVDGGLGMLQALGVKVHSSKPLSGQAGGGFLADILSIDLSPAIARLKGVRLSGLCDVKLPLLGPQGSRLFSPQKGARPDDVDLLEKGLDRFERVLSDACGRELRDSEGTGAAGGLGLAVLALGGTLESGFERIAILLDLEAKIRDCDVVVTGEGTLDAGSLGGKAPVGVARMAKAAGKPCIAFCGAVEPGLAGLEEQGFTGVLALFEGTLPPGDPRLEETRARLADAAGRLPGLLGSMPRTTVGPSKAGSKGADDV